MISAPVISLERVNHYYGEGQLRKQILFEITTDFHPGEIVILTGPSGSGKTTLLTLAGALRSVQEGRLTVLGNELNGAHPATLAGIRKSIGFIFQAHNLIDALNARQNVQMSLVLHGSIKKKAADERAMEMLTAVGLGHRVDYYPAQLSGGQKQRVAIARALVARPRIVLADEPTAALDKKSGREVVEILQQLAKEQGATILLVTHDHRILDIADRILCLEDGRITSFTKGLTANAGQMLHSLSELNRRGMLVQHLQDLPPDRFVETLQESTQELEQLLRTVEAAEKQLSETMLDQVLKAATLKIVDLMQVERAAIFLVDEKNRKLRSKVATTNNEELLEIVISLDEGIAGEVVRTAKGINLTDVANHRLFNPAIDRATGFKTRSLLTLPIYNRTGVVFAVAQLLNKRAPASAFTAEDENTFRDFTRALGLILESAHRLKNFTSPQELLEHP